MTALRFPWSWQRLGHDDPDFDWRAYLERYPDLIAAGIADRRGALRHWRRYGRAEGRNAAGRSATGTAMTCDSAHSMFVRAWGAIGCWDDAGSSLELQPFDRTVDYARDVFLGPPFAAIRGALRDHRMPFPEVCSRCVCLRSDGAAPSDHAERRVVELFQAEPSYRCTLDCPGCVRREVRRHAPRPHDLPPEVLAKILGDLAAAGVEIRGFSFQGHGEPTASPHLATLAEIVKAAYPGGYLAVATNCQATVSPRLVGCGIDELVCSVDGVDQATFEPYRVGGDFHRARSFMADLCRARELGATLRVVWRYVLFDHNDRDEHLEQLADLADKIGVDAVVLVFTQNGPASRRLRHPADLPRWTGSVPVEVRWDGPSTRELERRIALAREVAGDGRAAEARQLFESIAGLIDRFWPAETRRSPDQARLTSVVDDELARLSPTLR
jgi:organic radical activating enzyme